MTSVEGARVSQRDELTGSPTFIWAQKGAAQTKLRSQLAGMAPEQAALAQVANHAPLYGLSSFETAGAKVVSVSQNRQGVKVVKMEQEAGGIEVFRQSLNLLLNRDNELVAISGSLSQHVSNTALGARARFQLPATQAIAVAYKDLTGNDLDPSLLQRTALKQATGRYSHFQLASYARPLQNGLVIPARVKQVMYSLPTTLVPAYYVELNTGTADSNESDYYSYVVSAVDGSLLMRNNLTSHAEFSYRVYADATPPYTPYDGPAGSTATPHPTGTVDNFRPPYVAPNLVTLESVPYSAGDPWLPDGATVTTGNNVDAYADITAPDFFNAGDLRPTVTAPGVFDRTLDFSIAPNANPEQIHAATTSLFFMNNWLHDWYYDAGFNEAWGNAQRDNFERGGLGNDPIHAQAQDYTGINNANMSTPSDGSSPRMQMYLFSGLRNSRLTVNTPASIAGNYMAGVAAAMGPQTFDVTGDVVAAVDPVESTAGATSTDACSAITNPAEVAGKIALINRGVCNFNVKLENAQRAGAIGVIIADNAPGYLGDITGTSAIGVTIPSLRLTQDEGARLRARLADGVNVRLFRGASMNIDGTVDNAIVAHEWGHYISNRLIGDANGLTNRQGRAMGEGWGDFTALLMMARPEDVNVPSNANWNGVYAVAEYATRGISPDSAFFGIRRGGYSVDPTKNSLRFRHIMDGVPLPTTLFAPSGVNSQVHNSGEIWASMLWECYVALLRAHPFQEAQDRMKSYLVNGYKLTPVAPTYTEARDAILASAYANDPADGERLWAAFARRGMGVGAVAPDRFSTNHAGVVESYVLGTDVEFVTAYYADSATPGDGDGILDNGETGQLVIVAYNKGSGTASETSATVVSTTPGVTVGNRGVVNFPPIPAQRSGVVTIPVKLSGAGVAQRLDFTIAVRDDTQVTQGDKSGTLAFKANYDKVPNATITESVEAVNVDTLAPWSTEYDPNLSSALFVVTEFEDLNRAFYGPSVGAGSDLRLITPDLQVSADRPFTLTFRHAHDFEADASDNYDGAVIELSDDGGQTWVDVGSPVYNGALVEYDDNENPLAGRRAFVGTTPNFPELVTTTLNLGNAYAGRTVRLRFRIGNDNAVANTGWVLDDLAFSGITNLPFTKVCADTGPCGNTAPVGSAGLDVAVDERTPVTLAGNAYDLDGDALTYSWARVSGPVVNLTGGNTLTPSFTTPEVTANRDLVLRLTVSDGTSTSVDTVTVTIRDVNRGPTVNAGLDAVVDERGTATLMGSASDPENNPLTYLWTQVSGPPVALRNYNTATATFATPEVAFDETLSFRLTVSDGQASASDSVDVVVRHVNRVPVVTASNVTVDERSTATLVASGSDADGDAVSYAWTQLSGTPVVLSGADTATATFSTAEVPADAILTFRVTVSDGTAAASQDVVVNVRHINRAPTANAGLDASVNERATATLSGSASDADGDDLGYQWTQVSGTPVALSNAASAMATFTAPETLSGETLTFRLTVSDGKDTTSDTVDVTVNPVNRAPTVTASSVTVNERGSATLVATGADADGDALTYSWTQLTGTPVALSGSNTARVTFSTGEVPADAILTFRVTVSDGTATASQDVAVNVINVNRAPTADAGLDASVNERAVAILSGSAADADGDDLTYQWTQVAGTPVALSGAATATASFTAPETVSGETLTFRLTVSDGQASASDTVSVSVNTVNRAPAVTASSVTVNERSTATIEATASDADGDTLTYAWTQVAGEPVTLSGENTSRVTFSTGEVSADAVLTFRVTVSDGTATATQDVVVNVRHINRAPTANAGEDVSANERAIATLSGSAADADGDDLTYSWVQVTGTPVALSGATSATASFTAPETVSGETLTFRLTVSDGNLTTSDTVNVTVNAVNRAPTVTPYSVKVNERDTAILVATASDADGDTLTYAWTQVSGEPVELSGADTASASFSTGEVTADTELTFRLTVNDGTASATQDITVTVVNVNRAPTADAGAAVSVDERQLTTLNGSGTDADGDNLTYSWVQVAGTPVTLFGSTLATVTIIGPEILSAETLTFRLTVSDGTATASDTVDVTVNPVNLPPFVTAYAASANERSIATLQSFALDDDGDTLTYAWTQLSGPQVTLEGANTETATFATGEVTGDSLFTFRLSVSDGQATVTDDVSVLVRDVNRAPTVTAGLDASVSERATATLNGSATDADGDAITLNWVQVSGTAVALSGATTARVTFIAPETVSGETLTFRLTVSDGKLTTSDTVSVTVNAVNRAPTVAASDVTVDERSTASLVATAADPESDSLSFTWTQLTGTDVALQGANTATATFATGEVTADATLTFRVTVSDGTAPVSEDVTVTVRQVNRAPVANAGEAVSVKGKATVTLNGSASTDADGGALTYQWTQVGGPWVVLTGANTATPSFTAPDVKANTELAFRLVVSDSSLTSNPATVTVTVTQSDNIVPVAKARIVLSGDQTSMTLDGSASSDPDGDAISYKWEQTGGPSVNMGNANQAVLSVDVPELDDDSATFSFRLTVTDARGGTHTATVEATATPDTGGGCSSTGAGAPAGMLGLALLSLLRRRRKSA